MQVDFLYLSGMYILRYCGVYPRADVVMAEASLLQTLNNGTGTPFFVPISSKM